MSWAPTVSIDRGRTFKTNRLRFSTYQEAQDNVEAAAKTRHKVTDTAVFESNDPVTHAWHEGRLMRLPSRKEMS